jgi:hypothetical protein
VIGLDSAGSPTTKSSASLTEYSVKFQIGAPHPEPVALQLLDEVAADEPAGSAH